jgi:transposase
MCRAVRRYSIAFQQKVVREIESGELSIEDACRLYDITGNDTIQKWIRKFGRNHLLNKVVRIEMKDEKDRVKQLEKKIRQLESALANEHIKNVVLESLLDIAREDYPIFGLAYAYLMDSQGGHGADMSDMRKLFQFMAEGDGFMAAFSNALSIDVSWYQENFYALMAQYLSNLTSEPALSLKDKMEFSKDVREK